MQTGGKIMSQLSWLRLAQELFSKNKDYTNIPEKHAHWIVEVFDAVLNSLESIKNEACQTPAGFRWFSGQLKINPVSAFVVDKIDFIRKSKSDSAKINLLFENFPGNQNLYLLISKLLNELEKIIDSGLNRYISG